ncbi:nonsense-mediated decay protein [Aureococcus anophagefferens]|uniref:Nonsense-mediated decay protein n=1 Tax=Aureococcus anophagefferens TaxID=44056 RepID=A0ABR1FZA0_AURAN
MPKRKKRKDGDEDEALLGGAERARRAARRGGGGGGGKRRAKAPPADLKHWVLRWPLDDVAAPAAESRSRSGCARRAAAGDVADRRRLRRVVRPASTRRRARPWRRRSGPAASGRAPPRSRSRASATRGPGRSSRPPGRDAVATAGRAVAETAPGTRAVSVLAASLWFCDAWDDLVGDGWRCRDAGASLPRSRVDAALARRHWPRFLDGLVTGRAATHVRFADDDGGGGGAFGGDELADDIEDAFVTRDGFAVEEDEEARAVEEEEGRAPSRTTRSRRRRPRRPRPSTSRRRARWPRSTTAPSPSSRARRARARRPSSRPRCCASPRGLPRARGAPSNRAVTVTFDRVLRGCPALDAALVGVRASLVDDEAAPPRAARFAYTAGDARGARPRGRRGPGLAPARRAAVVAAHDVHDDAVRRARGADLAREFVEGSRVSVEAETLACLQNLAWSGRLLLVGDQCQLPATVVSPLAVRAGFDRSMLSRLAAARRGAWPEPAMLEIQYRMDPAIAAFPSGRWYGGRLRRARGPATATSRRPARAGLASGARRALVDVASGAERRDGAALANPREAALVAAAGRAAAATGASVAVLTFYAGSARSSRRRSRARAAACRPSTRPRAPRPTSSS